MRTQLLFPAVILVIAVHSNAHAIVGGVVESGYLPVAAIMDSSTMTPICTGTLTSNGWVLTAANCLFDSMGDARDQATLNVCFGEDVAGCQAYEVDDAEVHPGFDGTKDDIALLHLAGDIQAREFYPSHTANLAVGMSFTWVGFGGIDLAATGAGIKRSAPAEIDDLGSTTFSTSVQAASPCGTDRGAPAVGMVANNPVIIGIVSVGDSACESYVTHTRVDAYVDWIQTMIETRTPCEILGGSCGQDACFPTGDAFQCFPTDGHAVGSTCDVTTTQALQCEDGAICVNAGDESSTGICRSFCRVDGDCTQANENCEVVFADLPELGVCVDKPTEPSDMGNADMGDADMGFDTNADLDVGIGGNVMGVRAEDGCGCESSSGPTAPILQVLVLVGLFWIPRRRRAILI